MNSKDKYIHGPKSFGMTARTSFVDEGDKSIPGPGTHRQVRFDRSNPPQWKIGKSTQRDTFLDKFHFPNPPSNNYQPIFQFIQTRNPSYSIPNQDKQKYQKKHVDENNSLLYEPEYGQTKVNYPKFTMGYFQERDYRTETPAPNHYHKENQRVFFNFNKTQNSFTASDRPLPYGEEGKWPGVGTYVVEKSNPPPTYQYSIGRAERPEVIIGRDAPGTFYEIAGNMKKPGGGKTIPKNQKQHSQTPNPGPNHYNPHELANNQKIITTYANRAPLQNTAVLKYPSPQKYNTQTDFYRKKSLSFTRDPRDKNYLNENPGPGAHNIQAQFSTRSGVMGKKLKEQVKLITPGADHYSPNKQFVKQSSPRVINYYSNRVDFSKSLTGKQVGPGSYQIDKSALGELGKMSKSMKFPKNNNVNPGPGSYELPNGIGKLPKYYSGVKKLTNEGYSTFTMKMWQKTKKQQIKKQQAERQQQQRQNRNSQKNQ